MQLQQELNAKVQSRASSLLNSQRT